MKSWSRTCPTRAAVAKERRAQAPSRGRGQGGHFMSMVSVPAGRGTVLEACREENWGQQGRQEWRGVRGS